MNDSAAATFVEPIYYTMSTTIKNITAVHAPVVGTKLNKARSCTQIMSFCINRFVVLGQRQILLWRRLRG